MPQIPQISGPLTGGKTLTSGNSNNGAPQGAEPFSINGVNAVQRPAGVTQKGGPGGAENQNVSGKPSGSVGVPIAKDPSMAVETLHDVFSGDLLENAKLNGYTELVGEIDDLTKAIYINPDKLMNEILTQEKDNTVFSGDPLFDILRSISAESGEDTKELVAILLKSLNYAMSRNEIILAVKSNIKFLADYFGKGTTLSNNLNQLFQKWDSGNAAENFEALKNETAALMKTIEGSLQNDSRTEVLVPLVTHNLSRYNTNEYMMKEAFSQLMSQVPSSSMRDELSKAFTAFVSKLLTQAHSTDARENASGQNAYGGMDVSAEKAAILVYLSKLSGSLEPSSGNSFRTGSESAPASGIANGDTDPQQIPAEGGNNNGNLFAVIDEKGNALSGLRFVPVDENGNIIGSKNLIFDQNGSVAGEQKFAAVDENGNVIRDQQFITTDENGNALGGQRFAAVDEYGNVIDPKTDGIRENDLREENNTDIQNRINDEADNGNIDKYRSTVPLSESRISYILNNFNGGLIKGKDAIGQLLSLLIPRNAPDAAQVMQTVVKGTDNLSDLVNFLNKVLENTPDVPERQTLCDAFEDIVGAMAKNQEMPTQKFTGYESETMKALTAFIDRNVNHPAIRGIDNFNASNLLQSMLNAPGVFTPLAHYIIPLQVEDTRAFGELWVDNDNSSSNKGGENQEKHYHLFLTFDVEAVGRFEVDAYSMGNRLNLSVLYPKSYRYRVSSLTDKITKIAAGVGFSVENFKTGILIKPHSLAETFPRINENRRSFDVKA